MISFQEVSEPYEASLALQFENLGLGRDKVEVICGESRIDRIRSRRKRKRKARRKRGEEPEPPGPDLLHPHRSVGKKKKCRKCRKCAHKKEMRLRKRLLGGGGGGGSRSASPATSTASSVDSSESSAAATAPAECPAESPALKVKLLDIATDARFVGALYR